MYLDSQAYASSHRIQHLKDKAYETYCRTVKILGAYLKHLFDKALYKSDVRAEWPPSSALPGM